MPAEVREQALAKIDDLFRSSPDGLAVPAVRELVKEVYFTTLLLCPHHLTIVCTFHHSSLRHVCISAQLHCRGV